MIIEILNHRVIKDVASASGIIKVNDEYYVVGDDAPFLFKLNEDFEVISSEPIHSKNNFIHHRFEKSKKPDFEAMELIENEEIIIFGSGSKSPERDVFKRISLKNPTKVKSYQISEFYNYLKNLEILKNTYLNIEAVAYRNGEIFLFNRAKNIIFSFNYKLLISYFEEKSAMPSLKINQYKLPNIQGIEAGFSGATTLKNHEYIVFTASVENTPNGYDDGEILGSFVGMIPIKNNIPSTTFKTVLFPIIQDKLKVESVTIKEEIQFGKTNIVVVTDDDIKDSLIIDCQISW